MASARERLKLFWAANPDDARYFGVDMDQDEAPSSQGGAEVGRGRALPPAEAQSTVAGQRGKLAQAEARRPPVVRGSAEGGAGGPSSSGVQLPHAPLHPVGSCEVQGAAEALPDHPDLSMSSGGSMLLKRAEEQLRVLTSKPGLRLLRRQLVELHDKVKKCKRRRDAAAGFNEVVEAADASLKSVLVPLGRLFETRRLDKKEALQMLEDFLASRLGENVPPWDAEARKRWRGPEEEDVDGWEGGAAMQGRSRKRQALLGIRVPGPDTNGCAGHERGGMQGGKESDAQAPLEGRAVEDAQLHHGAAARESTCTSPTSSAQPPSAAPRYLNIFAENFVRDWFQKDSLPEELQDTATSIDCRQAFAAPLQPPKRAKLTARTKSVTSDESCGSCCSMVIDPML